MKKAVDGFAVGGFQLRLTNPLDAIG